MRVMNGVLAMTMLGAGLPATAGAQKEALPLVTEQMPSTEWDAMAQEFRSRHGKLMVATLEAPEKLVPCTVKELTTSGLTCKGKHGRDIVYGREQIAEVARVGKSVFVANRGDWLGLGLVAAIAGSASYGAAVFCGIGGLALLAAPPLALVAVVMGGFAFVVTAFSFDSLPGAVLYRSPVELKTAMTNEATLMPSK